MFSMLYLLRIGVDWLRFSMWPAGVTEIKTLIDKRSGKVVDEESTHGNSIRQNSIDEILIKDILL